MSLEQAIAQLTAAEVETLISSSQQGDEPLAGYHGSIHIIDLQGHQLVVKSVAHQGSLSWLRRRMLSNEFRAYQRLVGVAGIPRCYRLIDRQYLVLEHITGKAFRGLKFTADDQLHAKLLQLIKKLHENGIAHADLKRRDNIILSSSGEPFLVDFGTAIIRKDGFRPLNALLFRIARQLDYHGWYKNKYRDRAAAADPADEEYYRPMRTERAARWVRRVFRRPLQALRERLAMR